MNHPSVVLIHPMPLRKFPARFATSFAHCPYRATISGWPMSGADSRCFGMPAQASNRQEILSTHSPQPLLHHRKGKFSLKETTPSPFLFCNFCAKLLILSASALISFSRRFRSAGESFDASFPKAVINSPNLVDKRSKVSIAPRSMASSPSCLPHCLQPSTCSASFAASASARLRFSCSSTSGRIECMKQIRPSIVPVSGRFAHSIA